MDVGDAGIVKGRRTVLAKSEFFVEGHGLGLGVEEDGTLAVIPGGLDQRLDQSTTDSFSPPFLQDCDSADLAVLEESGSSDRLACAQDGEDVTHGRIQAVNLQFDRDTLFDNEDLGPDLADGLGIEFPVSPSNRHRFVLHDDD